MTVVVHVMTAIRMGSTVEPDRSVVQECHNGFDYLADNGLKRRSDVGQDVVRYQRGGLGL